MMIRPVLLAACALSCALASFAQAPASEVSKVDYYLREFESRIKFADGMQYELSKDDKRALEEVKAIAEKFPEDEKVKALVERGKAAYKLTKGLHLDFTDEMLAYRKREEKLGDVAKRAANEAWAALEKELAADPKTLKEALPAADPLKTKIEDLQGRRVVLRGVKYESALFVQGGVNWLGVGSAADGWYYVRAHGQAFEQLFEALRRFRGTVKSEVAPEWTIVARVMDAYLLSPTTGKAELGWEVEALAIHVPGAVFVAPDASRKEGASFAGEAEIAKQVAGSYTVERVPEDVTPEQLVRIYITAVKEKNFDLHLECIDPENRKHPEQVTTLRYYWEVQQKGLTTLHVHAEPAEVQPIRVVKGGTDESVEDFFGEDPGKKEEKKPARGLEERVTVKVRLYGPDGYQSAKPRFVTLVRRGKGRWYIYSGSTLTF